MQLIEAINTFNGVMDTDHADKDVAQGNYREMVNGENGYTNKDENGNVINVHSFLLIGNSFLTPNIAHKKIGDCEDKTGDSLLYMIAEGGGAHGIYRWYKNVPGYTNGRIEKILKLDNAGLYTTTIPNPLNFSFDSKYAITGAALVNNLFCWTDYLNRPRCLDVVRANETNKKRKFNIAFNRTNFGVTVTYDLSIYAANTLAPLFTLTWTSSQTDYAGRNQDFVNAYNASLTANQYFTVDNKFNYSTIELVQTGAYVANISESETLQSLCVPDNFYPDYDSGIPAIATFDLFTQDYLDFIKYNPLCSPEVVAGRDEAVSGISLIANKVFQFCLRYKYKTFEKSRLGAYSNIATYTVAGDGTQTPTTDNYIDIDFNDPRLINKGLVSMIDKIDLCVREHNEGQWRVFQTLQQYEFAGDGLQQKYRFYNNEGTIEVIATIDEVEQYDAVPLLAKSLENAEDRIFMGGDVDGYDKIPIKANVDIDYTPNIIPDTFSIAGIIVIRNVIYPNFNQFLYGKNIDTYGWGGINELVPGAPIANLDVTTQRFPDNKKINGFIPYLAGTDNYAISVQNVQRADGSYPVQFGAQGNIVDVDNPGKINNVVQNGCKASDTIRQFPFGATAPTNTSVANGGYLIGDATNAGVGIFFSRFEIQNVKAGKYVLRMASPSDVTLDILNNGTKEYQETSAALFSIGGQTGFEFLVTVSDDDAAINPMTGRKTVFVGVTEISDLTYPYASNSNYRALLGYLSDEYNGAAPTTYAEALAKTRINYAKIFPNNGYSISVYAKYDLLYGKTDHNGFFYFGSNQNSGFNPDAVTPGQVGTYVIPAPPGLTMFDKAGGAFVNTGSTAIISATIPTNVEISTNRRTHITGSVLDTDGRLLDGVNIVPLKCQWQHTVNGFYSIVTYTETPLDEKVIEVLFQSGSNSVVLQIQSGTDSYFLSTPVTIDITSVDYNDITSYTLADVIFTVLAGGATRSVWKPGSDIQYGLVYYDEGDRRCAVLTNTDLAKHILFFNEKDENGDIQPTGERILSWQIYHEPPVWATKYHWVRTLNLQHGLYLEWAINKIQYVDDIDTNVGYSSPAATLGKLSFDNVPFYTINKYPGAIIDFGFQVGDRIRVMTGLIYTEAEIVKIIEPYFYIRKSNSFEFTQGMMVELFHPREQADVNIFYEFGECYQVKWGTFAGVCKKYHTGQTQDQSFGTIPLSLVTPATGTFQTGNAWLRYRNIPVNVTAATLSDPAINGGVTPQIVYDGSISDFYSSYDENIGRPNSTELLGRIEKPTEMCFGDQYLYGSQINGLCTFRALNRKTYNYEYGLLNKLILVKQEVMYLIFHNSYTLSVYLGKSVLRDLTGQLLVAISDDIVSKSEKMQRTFGSQDPATIQLNDEGDVVGVDIAQGVAWRASGNGLVNLAEYLMKGWWNETCNQRRRRTTNNRAIATYDILRDKYIITLPLIAQQSNVYPKTKVCIANFEQNTVITGHLSLNPSLPLFTIPLIYSVWNGDTNAAIAWYLTAIGYTVVTLDCGCIEITFPNMAYAGATLSIKTTAASLIAPADSLCNSTGSWVANGGWSNFGGKWQYGNVIGSNVISSLQLNIPIIQPNTDYLLQYTITQAPTDTTFELGVSICGINVINYFPVVGMVESIPFNSGSNIDTLLSFDAQQPNTTTEYIGMDNVYLIPVIPISHNYNFVFDSGVAADTETSPAYTIAFQKQSVQNEVQGWKTFYEFYPEGYGKLRNDNVMFQDGELWLARAGAGFNNFFGVQRTRRVKYVVNQDYGVTKGFKAIATFSRNAQDVPEITIPPNIEYPNGMSSRLVKANFRIFNGELYSETLRDQTTPLFLTALEALINGRALQGESATITIEDDSFEQSALKYCKTVYFYVSKF